MPEQSPLPSFVRNVGRGLAEAWDCNDIKTEEEPRDVSTITASRDYGYTTSRRRRTSIAKNNYQGSTQPLIQRFMWILVKYGEDQKRR